MDKVAWTWVVIDGNKVIGPYATMYGATQAARAQQRKGHDAYEKRCPLIVK